MSGRRRPRLVLLNGAPGSGKSTLAQLLAETSPGELPEARPDTMPATMPDPHRLIALDIDAVKHALPDWQRDPSASGRRAREIVLETAGERLRAGDDVVIGQFLAREEFIDELSALADYLDAVFVEIVLTVDETTLRRRLERRARRPERPEHEVNAALVGPDDAPDLLDRIERLIGRRRRATLIDASGDVETTLALLRSRLEGDPQERVDG
jgi:predicted kinase